MKIRWMLGCLLVWQAASGVGQQQPAPEPTPEQDRAQVLAETTAMRDRWVAAVHAAGFHCAAAPPEIVVEDVPSFGNYDGHVLHTSAWTLLQPHERALFQQLAGPGADEAAVRGFFDEAVHRWIFVHEMGHWWEHCSGGRFDTSLPWNDEYNANRIDLAYWREADGAFAGRMVALFEGMVSSMPSPVPAGKELVGYFNAHYQELGPGPSYPWFQARMITMAAAEKPEPRFAEALAGAKKP